MVCIVVKLHLENPNADPSLVRGKHLGFEYTLLFRTREDPNVVVILNSLELGELSDTIYDPFRAFLISKGVKRAPRNFVVNGNYIPALLATDEFDAHRVARQVIGLYSRDDKTF